MRHALVFIKTARTTTILPADGTPYQADVWRVWCSCGWEWRRPLEGRHGPTLDDYWLGATLSPYTTGTETSRAHRTFLELWLREHIAKVMADMPTSVVDLVNVMVDDDTPSHYETGSYPG